MFIDLHCHSKGISRCSRIDASDLVRVTKECGFDALVLTNHYTSENLITDNLEFAKRYVEEYEYTKRCGERIGVPVFFGVEVTLENHDWEHLLLLGIDKEFVINHPNLYEYKIEDLYKLVHEHNGIVIQAHPLRKNNNKLLDPNFLDGVEANCHFNFEGPHMNELIQFAKEHNLIITAGSDYHGDTIKHAICGLKTDKNISSIDELVSLLKSRQDFEIVYQEDMESTPKIYKQY